MMAKRKLLGLLGLVLAVVLVAAPASALPTVGWEWSTSTVDFTDGSWSLGLQFNIVNAPFQVTYLGFYDDQGNGLTESHAVGIWNAAGTLLTSTTVVPGDFLEGHFRWAATSPVVLPVADGYVIAAVTGSENYTWDPSGYGTDSRVVFVTDMFTQSAVLVEPVSSVGGTNAWYGPNMGVPVPPTVLLLGSGLLGLVGWRRLRKS